VSAELEIDTGLLGLLEVVRLMVEKEDVSRSILSLKDLRDGLAVRIASVVATCDKYVVAEWHTGVDKQVDAGLAVEVLGLPYPGDILVVAETGINWGVEPMKLLVHLLLIHRIRADIDNVSRNED
jgi:hypothetical protein